MSTTTTVIVIAVWVTAGVLPALVMMRRGHRSGYWILIGIGLGPFTAPILWERMEGDRPTVVEVEAGADPSESRRSVLIAIDGPATEHAAMDFLHDAFEPSTTTVTLVTVLDFDAPSSARAEAAERLARAAEGIQAFGPRVLLIDGAPLEQLLTLIRDRAPTAVVVGARGTGVTKALLGSVTSGLLKQGAVPLVVVPTDEGQRRSE